MPYLSQDVLIKAAEQNAPILVDIEEKCISCNKQSHWTLLAIHVPDMIWMCYDCYNRSNYNQDIDYITINNERVYWSRMMYKIWRGFISNDIEDDRWYSE